MPKRLRDSILQTEEHVWGPGMRFLKKGTLVTSPLALRLKSASIDLNFSCDGNHFEKERIG